ncbi:MAG: DUF1572 family protein [Bryobacterales bacterium]|nr:DUF1572 family protein [Acidobacteriota bacterium]MCB9386140.1 DUF1572 family protein [Bryobacterales bacterium]
MSDRFRQVFIDDMAARLATTKKLADRSLAQASDAAFFERISPESTTLAEIVKHMAGNMRSRWTDWLTSDGEKPDRDRDSEFEIGPEDTRASLMERWEAGWALGARQLAALPPEDLDRTILIRGEPHSVCEALHRMLGHMNQHAGQIAFLARHLAGDNWTTLTIPRGGTKEFNAKMARKFGQS